jgi:opacity protein-like surface antigen
MKLSKLVAVALLAPAVAFAAPRSGSRSSSTAGSPLEGLEVGGFVGYETDDVSGLSLRLDGEVPFRQLAPQLNLSFVGSFGYSYLTWDPGPGSKFTANVLKLVPAARFTLPLNEQFSVFGDAGLGLAYVHASVKYDWYGLHGSSSDSSLNLMMRLGVGAWYHLNPQVKLGAMLEFDPVFGDYGYSGNSFAHSSQSTFLIQIGGMFKI